MAETKRKELTKEFKKPFLKTEGWFMKTVEINKTTTVVAELIGSFILLFLIVLPQGMTYSAYLDGGAFTWGWDYLTEVNAIRVLWLSTISWIGYITFRKFGLAINPLSIAYKYGRKEISFMNGAVRFGAEIGGAMLAVYLVSLISMHIGTWVPDDIAQAAGSHGSTIGAVQPVVKGWGISWSEGYAFYDGDYGFYTARFFLELAMLTASSASLLYFRNHTFRKNVVWRYVYWIVTIGLFIRFTSHSPNLNRWLAGTAVMQMMGGYANWELFGFVAGAHVTAWIGLIWVLRSKHVPWIK